MEAGNILIVDDSATVRLKLTKAVQALGHRATAVSNGSDALAEIRRAPYDLILLDIVMPEMDGFDVLGTLKSDPKTRDLPVIVISALDDKMDSVVKAIGLGAEDFLHKDFEPALLEARVSTSIEKKRLRDLEIEYLRQVDMLAMAAKALESTYFNPRRLGLQDISARQDGLGTLAKVFIAMAQKVYERERKLRQNIRTFRGGLLLIACGILWGLNVPLSKLVSQIVVAPVGLAAVVDIICATLCLGYCAFRGKLPSLSRLTRQDWTFIFVYALLSSAVNKVLVYWIAGLLPSFIVAVVIVLEGFVVFLFSAVMRIETPTAKRLAGLAVGLAGVSIILVFGSGSNDVGGWISLVLALVIPVTYAAEDIYISERRPQRINAVALFGLASAVSALMLVPAAWLMNDLIPLNLLSGKLGALSLLMAVSEALAVILFFYLIATTGAVFASQNAYAITAAGIAWSIMLLGENVPVQTWGSLALIVLGLILVEPKREAEAEPTFDDLLAERLPGSKKARAQPGS